MKNLLLFLPVLCLSVISFSQNTVHKNFEKSGIDTNVFNNWPSLYRFGLSNNGNFVYFTTTKGQKHSNENLTIKSLSGDWQTNILIQGGQIKFTNDNKTLLCLKSGDSLCIFSLNNANVNYISPVQFFNLLVKKDTEYLIYQFSSPDKNFILQNVKTGKQFSFKYVSDYLTNSEKSELVLKIDSVIDGKKKEVLLWINIIDGTYKEICDGININSLVFNDAGDEMSFIKEDDGYKSIWHCKRGDKAVKLLSGNNIEIDRELEIDGISRFNLEGSKLFFYLKEKVNLQAKSNIARLTVWSYTDVAIQSQQKGSDKLESYLAVVDLKSNKVIRLQYENDEPIFFDGKIDNVICIVNQKGSYYGDYQSYWNYQAKPSLFLVSVEDGSRTKLHIYLKNPKVSPDRRYLIGYDETSANIYGCELGTRKIINLTQNMPSKLPVETLHREVADRPGDTASRGLSFAAWMGDDKMLIYDEFDIWEVDLTGKSVPINVTKGFGRKNNIEFRLVDFNLNEIVTKGNRLITSAFNRSSKESGFYEIIDTNSNPKLLSMGNYMYASPLGVSSPIKAKSKDIYIVQRETATQSPNLYWTKDFKTFASITNISPEKEFNWLTAELKNFRTLGGRIEKGVLYKPENFDDQKSYPAIIHYYEKKSNELNKFHTPGGDGNGGSLDIAWFVSHGYIVFTPDIHYEIGETGQSAYTSIVSAAKYLELLSYINPRKIGIQGHSFGGYETNYVVANSKIFAAAISSSGASNFITRFLSEQPREQFQCEIGQSRLGRSLWENLPSYINNSPVFKAYNVTTPILLVHNQRDYNVPFIQGLQWFMALRRLGKRAWLLQYDDGGHGVAGKDYIDYVIRSTQFFDHYLKDSACPKWMLYGIPKKKKEIEDGLELIKEKDDNGKWLTPQEGGLLTDEQRKKVEALQKIR